MTFRVLPLFALFAAAPVLAAEPVSVNRLALSSGAFSVVDTPSYGGWEPAHVLDDAPSSGWASESGQTSGQTLVFELPEPATFERFEFDAAACLDGESRGAKGVRVSLSSEGKDKGFKPALEVTLKKGADNQKFPVKGATGRFVKLEILSNQGDKEYVELCSFRGFAPPATPKTAADIAGTYGTTYGNFHVRQQGSSLTGCYEHNDGLLTGSVEGRVMRITWQELGSNDNSGPAVMVFAPDGKSFRGYWWTGTDKDKSPDGEWVGEKLDAKVGTCPNWSGSVGGEVERQLEKGGRAVVYGVEFDFDKADLKPKSKPVLDEVARALAAHKDWKVSIEGHTDSVGSADHNQNLSEARAAAVRAYLAAHGVAADRLSSMGYGASHPVADNATELGRARNRRVEIVKQ